MFLTKECDYGIRMIRSLADGEKKTVRTICDLEYIPHQYAYKILKKLERAGFVQSRQGPDGGYRLVRQLNSFTLFDIIVAIDKDLFLFECVQTGHTCPRNDPKAPCAVHQELERIQSIMLQEMQSKTMDTVLLL